MKDEFIFHVVLLHLNQMLGRRLICLKKKLYYIFSLYNVRMYVTIRHVLISKHSLYRHR
jgi:hypothetical protein